MHFPISLLAAGAPPSAEDQAYLASVQRHQRSEYERQRKQTQQDELDFTAAISAISSKVPSTSVSASAAAASTKQAAPMQAAPSKRPRDTAAREEEPSPAQQTAQPAPILPKFTASQLPAAGAVLGRATKKARPQPPPQQEAAPAAPVAAMGLVQYGSSDDSDGSDRS